MAIKITPTMIPTKTMIKGSIMVDISKKHKVSDNILIVHPKKISTHKKYVSVENRLPYFYFYTK